MLDLHLKLIGEIEDTANALRSRFDQEYKELKNMDVVLPKGRIQLGHADLLSQKVAEIRDLSNRSAQAEQRWLRAHQEFEHEANRRRRQLDSGISFSMSEFSTDLKGLRGVAERKDFVVTKVPHLLQQSEELQKVQLFAEEAKGWLEFARKRHSKIREAHSDVLTMTSLMKILTDANQLRGSRQEPQSFEDSEHGGSDNQNSRESYDSNPSWG